jgi:translation initiation factor 2B subunit (eIF-2B alpha/beta/delta family)
MFAFGGHESAIRGLPMLRLASSVTATAAFITAVMLVGCAAGTSQGPDAGERMAARGSSITAQGADWSSGQRDVQKGQKQMRQAAERSADAEKALRKASAAMAKAEQQIQTAQSDQLAAEQLVASGKARMVQAEADYGVIRTQPSALQPQ